MMYFPHLKHNLPYKTSVDDIDIVFMVGEIEKRKTIEVWFIEKRYDGHICFVEFDKINEKDKISKLYDGLKKWGFKLPDKNDFIEKFSKIYIDFL